MSFNLQPTLIGKKLKLQPLRPDDFEELFQAASDRLIWEQHPSERYKIEVFRTYFSEALDSKGAFIVRNSKTEEAIGCTRYYELNEDQGSVAIGYTFLKRSHWGGGFNREMKHLMVAHALESLDTIFFHIDHENRRSQKAVEKIGAFLVDRKMGEEGRIKFVYKLKIPVIM